SGRAARRSPPHHHQVLMPHWSNYLRTADPEKPLLGPKDPNVVEGQDEQQWGQQRVLQFRTSGTGPTALSAEQLTQVRRPARVWSATLAFSVLGVSDAPLIPASNSTLT